MSIVQGYFDALHFTESKVEDFEITENSIIINIRKGLEIYPPHPLTDISKFDEPCKVIFRGVIFSKRILYESDEIHVFTENFSYNYDPNVVYSEYSIEGAWIKTSGWIEWEIKAAEFYIDDLKG